MIYEKKNFFLLIKFSIDIVKLSHKSHIHLDMETRYQRLFKWQFGLYVICILSVFHTFYRTKVIFLKNFHLNEN